MCECLFHLIDETNHGHDGGCPLLRCVFCQQSHDPPRNVFSAVKNKVLMGLTEGGMQHLMAGARASVGVKTGRCLVKLRPSGRERSRWFLEVLVSRVADDPTNSNSECSISQVKIKHELCNTTLSCLPFAAWSFGIIVCHVLSSCELCFADHVDEISRRYYHLWLSWNYHETIHKPWAKGKVRDPTTEAFAKLMAKPLKFPWGSTAPAHEISGYFYEVKILESFTVNEAAQGDRDGRLEKTSGTTFGKEWENSREWFGKHTNSFLSSEIKDHSP